MSEETKQRIIEAGAELIHKQGFNNTGLKDILKAADVPKGSFYFYFDNKEAFGVEVVNHYATHFAGVITPILSDESMAPLDKLKAIFSNFRGYFESQGFTRGCPVGNLAQEMSDLSPAFRERLQQALRGLDAAVRHPLREAQKAGELPGNLDTRATASFIISAWHGAIIRMKVVKTGEPLDNFYRFVFDTLLK